MRLKAGQGKLAGAPMLIWPSTIQVAPSPASEHRTVNCSGALGTSELLKRGPLRHWSGPKVC